MFNFQSYWRKWSGNVTRPARNGFDIKWKNWLHLLQKPQEEEAVRQRRNALTLSTVIILIEYGIVTGAGKGVLGVDIVAEIGVIKGLAWIAAFYFLLSYLFITINDFCNRSADRYRWFLTAMAEPQHDYMVRSSQLFWEAISRIEKKSDAHKIAKINDAKIFWSEIDEEMRKIWVESNNENSHADYFSSMSLKVAKLEMSVAFKLFVTVLLPIIYSGYAIYISRDGLTSIVDFAIKYHSN